MHSVLTVRRRVVCYETQAELPVGAGQEYAVGIIDARLIRQILGERMSFAECAALRGRTGDRGARYYAARFRDALEIVAERFAAKGTGR